MKLSRAFTRVKNGLSDRVYKKVGSFQWRIFSHHINGMQTKVVHERNVPGQILAEHYATGSSVIYTDGFFRVRAVEDDSEDNYETVVEIDWPQRKVVVVEKEDDGAAVIGRFAGGLLRELLR